MFRTAHSTDIRHTSNLSLPTADYTTMCFYNQMFHSSNHHSYFTLTPALSTSFMSVKRKKNDLWSQNICNLIRTKEPTASVGVQHQLWPQPSYQIRSIWFASLAVLFCISCVKEKHHAGRANQMFPLLLVASYLKYKRQTYVNSQCNSWLFGIYSVPIFTSLVSYIQGGYLNANVSMYQTEGTVVGSTNREPLLLSQGGWRGEIKPARVVFEGFGT